MSSMNVGELAAYLTLDDSQFQAKLGNAKSGLSGLSSFAKATGQAVATTLTVGSAAAAAMAVNIVKTGASYNVLQQNSRAALMTLLGSQEKVNAQMEKLNELTSRSPFGKDVFITAQQQLISFGMAAEKVVPTLDAVQNAVAATGGSSQQLSEITYVLAQIQAAGKITATDLMQLGQRGIDAATLIGSQMGKTGAEIREMITKGQLSADDAIDALTKGMTAKFGGATDLIKQQWSGAADRIKAAWRDTGAVIAKPFIDPNGGGQAVVWGNLVADTMRSVQKQVTSTMDVVDAKAGPVFQKGTDLLREANVAVTKFDITKVLNQLESLSGYTPLVSAAGAALLTYGAAPIPVLGKLVGGINPVVAGVAALVATSPDLRRVGGAFTDALEPAVPQLEEAGKGAADLAMELIDALTPGLTQVATGVGGFISDMSPLVPMLVDAAGAVAPLVSGVADLAGWVANLPTPLLATATAVAAFHGPLGTAKTWILDLENPLKNVGNALSNGRAAVSLFADSWVTARANGVPNMKAIVGATNDVVTATSGASSVGAAMGNSLKGLISPANLVGAGLTVLTGVVAMYAAKKAEAKQKVDDFIDSLDEETGALTENSRAQIANSLKNDGSLKAYQELGGASADYVGALMGEQDAQERYNAVLDAARKKAQDLALASTDQAYASQTSGDYMQIATDKSQKSSNAAQDLIDKVTKVTGGYESQAVVINQATDAKQAEIEATQNATQAAKDQKAALDNLYDAIQKQAAANGDLVSAQYATKDAMQALADAASTQGQMTLDAAGNIDTAADSNRGFVEASLSAVQAINDQTSAAQKAGQSQTDLDATTKQLTDGFYKQVEALGYSHDQAVEFGKALGLIPDRKSVTVDMTADTTAATTDIQALIDEAAGSTGYITIDATSDPAAQELADSLGLVSNSAGTYSINAADDPALAVLFASLGLVNTSTGTITLDGDDTDAQAKLKQALEIANGSTGTMSLDGNAGAWNDKVDTALQEAAAKTGTMKLDADNTLATNRLNTTLHGVNNSVGIFGINAEDRGATATADTIVRSINGKTAYIKIFGQQVAQGAGGTGGITQANGGIVKYFASGGVENHVAQIAPAGAYRLWAEQETGGEAYIPLALSKRARSTQILAQLAREFGDVYIPANQLRAHANGDTNATPYQGPQNAPVIMFPDRILATFVIDNTTTLDGYIDGRALAAQAQTSADVSLYRGGRR